MAIDKEGFQFVCALLKREAAIVLDESKEYLVESRLSQLARREGLVDANEICRRIIKGDAVLVSQVVESMTTNETSFFRDQHPFEALQSSILPAILERSGSGREIRIWSAASSSGQEAYSIAMLIKEHFSNAANFKIDIIGTDISTEMVRRAAAGSYSQLEVNRGLPAKYLVKYFRKEGHEWFIKDDIRSMVRFEKLNLASPVGLVEHCDVIFMRNVLIYFDIKTKREILSRVGRALKPNGVFFLGAAETTLYVDDNFERCSMGNASCYRLKTVG
ncbi:MAG: protein-glutamate O-methyltransferase CheR [bacterium]|nr:protein-glutamate O-methyltransferase CheR [bacterium]